MSTNTKDQAPSPDRVETMLDMFERESAWQWEQATEALARLGHYRGLGMKAPAIQRRLEEIQRRSAHLLREYWRWLEREGVQERVQEILRERKPKA